MTRSSHPALLGIRHVALFVRDLGAAERFWVDVLGYEVEWRPDADNVYLRGGRTNPRSAPGCLVPPRPRPDGQITPGLAVPPRPSMTTGGLPTPRPAAWTP